MKDYSKIFTKGRTVWVYFFDEITEGTVLGIENEKVVIKTLVSDITYHVPFRNVSTSPFALEVKGFEQKEALPEIAQKTPVWAKFSTIWDIVLFHSFSGSGMLACGIYDQYGNFIENDRFSEWSLTDPFEKQEESKQKIIKDISESIQGTKLHISATRVTTVNETNTFHAQNPTQEDEPKIGDEAEN